MHRLSLALLGSPQLAHAQLGQIALPNRKALALLTYLAVEAPTAQSRETLLGLLWPELPDAEARNNLRVTWAWLRQRLGDDTPGVPPLLHSTRLDLRINADVGIWFDLREFNTLVRACEQHQHSQRDECAACQERLAQATARFQEAVASFRAIDKAIMAYEAEIGLAELHRRQGALTAALALIKPIIPQLPAGAADGWDAPLRAYVVCVQILQAVHDPAAELILDQGLQLLNALAQNIGDQSLRRSFLQAITAHHKLRALHSAAVDDAPNV